MTNDEALRLDNQLCFLLYAASRAVTRLYGPLLDGLGLTYPQYLTMLVLWENDGVEVGTITRLLHMDTGTMSPLLKRLEAGGLIVRNRAKDDERKVIVSLTKKGADLKRKAVSVPGALLCRSGLSFQDYAELKARLTDVLDTLERGAG
ncbi:MAG TPA: MarR family transcriptional regulator [Spirochaetota bacterium]|nr:MarR family transcriptional regulator [Spirochaetota bacterium]HOS40053.1 MarR family transcriptional regulator [Spirochaetota bacterium]HPI21891.1 MarR family transcriptional regulator [Spirochaetota bacterium]HPU88105.1 MarR family transcriptional regulator [Spirochaetota bacterium]